MLGPELQYCWLKIGRAIELANSVNEEVLDWRKVDRYKVSSERDIQGRNHRLIIHFDGSLNGNLDRWSLICGDCIHNLRSALDHLVYAIAVKESGSAPPPSKRVLQFPITDNPHAFSDQEWRIKSLSPAVRARIEAVQPYSRPHRLLPPLLALIRDFDDRDKHRSLNVAVNRQQRGDIDLGIPAPHRAINTQWNNGDLVDGTELVAFTVEPPSRDVKCQYDITITIGLCHAPGPCGVRVTAIDQMLSWLIDEVKTIVEIIGTKA